MTLQDRTVVLQLLRQQPSGTETTQGSYDQSDASAVGLTGYFAANICVYCVLYHKEKFLICAHGWTDRGGANSQPPAQYSTIMYFL